jgi:hypothetical protein
MTPLSPAVLPAGKIIYLYRIGASAKRTQFR